MKVSELPFNVPAIITEKSKHILKEYVGKKVIKYGNKHGYPIAVEEIDNPSACWSAGYEYIKDLMDVDILVPENSYPSFKEMTTSYPYPTKKKFDVSSFTAQFLQKVNKIKKTNPELFEHIIKRVCEGTQHTNLINYHQDYNIDILTKINVYTAVLCAIEESNKATLQHDETPFASVPNNPKYINDSVYLEQIKELQENYKKLQYNLTEREEAIKEGSIAISQYQQQIEELKKGNPTILQIVDRILNSDGSGTDNTKVTIGPEERFHKQLPEILDALLSRNAQGYTEFIYLWGAAGSGKTFLGKQLAKCLGVKYYPYPADPTVTSGKLLGFNNIATGTFIEGWLYRPYKNGGLVLIDEGDLMDASCFAGANSIENSDFTFGNGEHVERHKDFYMIVSANTRGTGATKGFQRNKLDAATLDRFTMIELKYDEDLECQIYGNKKWAQYVQRVRGFCHSTFKDTVHITSRSIRKGAALLNRGKHSIEWIERSTIFKLFTDDQLQQVINSVGHFNTETLEELPVKKDYNLWINSIKDYLFNSPDTTVSKIKTFREVHLQFFGKTCGLAYAKSVVDNKEHFFEYTINWKDDLVVRYNECDRYPS